MADSPVPAWRFHDHGRVGSTAVVRLAEARAELPTGLAPPDVRSRLDDQEWGAAVKHVRSGNQLAKRTTEARLQLEEQKLRGVIVVNVDAFLEGVPASGAPGEIGRSFDAG